MKPRSPKVEWNSALSLGIVMIASTTYLQSSSNITFVSCNSAAQLTASKRPQASASFASGLPHQVFAFTKFPASSRKHSPTPKQFGTLNVAALVLVRYPILGFCYVWSELGLTPSGRWFFLLAWSHSRWYCCVWEVVVHHWGSTSSQSFSFLLFRMHHRHRVKTNWFLPFSANALSKEKIK